MPSWTETDIPDQTGRFAIVTGATSGIGRETARALAEAGARVLLAVRDVEKGMAVAAEMRGGSPNAEIEVARLDLANLASVAAFAEAVLASENRLDLLVDNAGVMIPPLGHTEDGFELQMGTNHVGHFALTLRLMPLLAATEGARVVVVSSLAHRQGRVDFNDLDWRKRRYSAMRAYGDSKLANLWFTFELMRRLDGAGPSVAAAHPGFTTTDLMRHSTPARLIAPLVGQPARRGALPSLRAATDPTVRPGDYFGPAGLGEMRGLPVRVASTALSRDQAQAARLWQVSEARTGVRFSQ